MTAETAQQPEDDAKLVAKVGPAPSAPRFTKGITKRLLVALAIVSGFAAAVVWSVPLCPVAIFFRQPCPGCGLTRSAIYLARGDVGGALAFHPLAPLVVPLAGIVVGANLVSYVARGRGAIAEGARGRAVTGAAVLVGLAMVAVWVARFLGAFGGPVAV